MKFHPVDSGAFLKCLDAGVVSYELLSGKRPKQFAPNWEEDAIEMINFDSRSNLQESEVTADGDWDQAS